MITTTERPLEGKVAVITGTSRGIGAQTAIEFARAGINVIGNHVSPQMEGRQVKVEQLAQFAGSESHTEMFSVRADISTPRGRKTLLEATLRQYPEGIDYLVLNAAGGLEDKKPEYWARRINVTSQNALVNMFLPHLRPEGVIIYPVSVWSHKAHPNEFNGGQQVRMIPFYHLVAETKHQEELILRKRVPELAARSQRLAILSGHIIKDTGAYSLLMRYYKERLAELQTTAKGGEFPDAHDMALGALDLVTHNYPSGHTLYIGGDQAEPIDVDFLQPHRSSRADIEGLLPMYGQRKLLVHEFRTDGNKLIGTGYYEVDEQDCDGHFDNEYRDVKLFRGVDRVEMGAQVLGLTLMGLEPDAKVLPFFRGTRQTDFTGMVFPGDTVVTVAELTHVTPASVKGRVEMFVNERSVGGIKGIDLALVPVDRAKRMVEGEREAHKRYRETILTAPN